LAEVAYAEGLVIRWTETEMSKIAEIKARPISDRSICIRTRAVEMLLASGMSAKEISDIIGMSYVWVCRIINPKNKQPKKHEIFKGKTHVAREYFNDRRREEKLQIRPRAKTLRLMRIMRKI
jgi:transposase